MEHPPSLEVVVLFFAGTRELIGSPQVSVDMPKGTTLADLRKELVQQYPGLDPLLKISRWAVDEAFVGDEYPLRNGLHVASIPPVSGG